MLHNSKKNPDEVSPPRLSSSPQLTIWLWEVRNEPAVPRSLCESVRAPPVGEEGFGLFGESCHLAVWGNMEGWPVLKVDIFLLLKMGVSWMGGFFSYFAPPTMIIFSRKNPWFFGKPTILGNPHNMDMFMKKPPKKDQVEVGFVGWWTHFVIW